MKVVRALADILLDATVFLDYKSGIQGARSLFEQIVRKEVSASVSPFTVFQLWGMADLDRQAEMGYTSMLAFLDEAPLTVQAAKTAGLWIASLPPEERAGLLSYALLVATATERGEQICTRNMEPFRRFPSELREY